MEVNWERISQATRKEEEVNGHHITSYYLLMDLPLSILIICRLWIITFMYINFFWIMLDGTCMLVLNY